MIEVERKYLVKNNSYKMQAQRAGLIVQGYLGDNPLSETRIAIRDNHGWLFIKAKGTLSRFEWQQEIPLYEAQELLKFCPNIIRKVRYIVYHMGNKWYAEIQCNGQRINLGSYSEKEDAIKARLEAEIKYFGKYKSQVLNEAN